jgi:hypothetical protein
MVEVAEAMAGHEDDFTPDQADYFDTLCALIEAYETEAAPVPKGTPFRTVEFLFAAHGLIRVQPLAAGSFVETNSRIASSTVRGVAA